MMHSYAAMDLVVQTDFLVLFIVPARELHPVHAQVGIAGSGVVGVFGINLGQGDEGATVGGPAFQLGQLAYSDAIREHRAAPDPSRLGAQQGQG